VENICILVGLDHSLKETITHEEDLATKIPLPFASFTGFGYGTNINFKSVDILFMSFILSDQSANKVWNKLVDR